jgi:hypothetical protein
MKNAIRFPSLLLPVLLAAALAAPTAARASDAFGLDLGIHGGAVGVGDSSKTSLFVGGAQLRAHLVWIVAAEARVSYYTDTYDVSSFGSVDVKNLPVQLSAMLYIIQLQGFGLYVLGGGTYNSLKLEGTGNVSGKTTTEGKWATHAGAGLDLKISRSFLLNLDGRYVFLDVDPRNLPPPSSGAYKGDYWMATAGIVWKIF